MKTYPVGDTAESRTGLNAARQYIAVEKGWRENEYRIAECRREKRHLVYFVDYLADRQRLYPGGGKSIELYYDPRTHRIVEELGGQ